MQIYHSSKGYLCAESQGKNIHSRYNPDREAQRFIDQSIEGNPSLIVLLGAGLGYIQRAVRDSYPQAKILSVFHHDMLYENQIDQTKRNPSWFPSSSLSTRLFFNRHIKEKELRDMAVIEWDPSARIFPELSLQINQSLKECVQQLNGNIHTTAFFGKLWLRNMLTNFLLTEKYATPSFPSAPVVIASSGPSLEKSLDQLRRYRNKYLLFALPSSLYALKESGLKPDLQISSDPGYYGSVHLRHLFDDVPLAHPFTSCRGSWKKDIPFWILNQETPFEKDLFAQASIPGRCTPSNGTVSGTAYELAKGLTQKIYFAGLDLSFSDIRSHIRPHSFDILLESETDKRESLHSLYFKRAEGTVPDFEKKIRTGRSLDIYRNWFSALGTKGDITIKRLNPSPVSIENVNEGSLEELKDSPPISEYHWEEIDAPGKEKRKEIIATLLNKWTQNLQDGSEEDLFYFIDTESFTSGNNRDKALNYINRLKEIYA